jgi:hypothetical protein
MTWAPDYVTGEAVAAFAHVDDDIDDAEYARAATTASRSIDHATHRQFGRTASESRLFTPRWSYTRGGWIIECDDMVTVTAVAVDTLGTGVYTTIDLASVVKLDANAPQRSRPWERLLIRNAAMPSFVYPHDCVRVTSEFGWASVPVAIEEATLLQASRLASRRDSPFGVAGSPDAGSEIRLLAKLDPDVMTSIKDYVRRVLP